MLRIFVAAAFFWKSLLYALPLESSAENAMCPKLLARLLVATRGRIREPVPQQVRLEIHNIMHNLLGDGAQIAPLGEGTSAWTFRIFNKNRSKVFILKVYKQIDSFRLENDLHGMHFLRNFFYDFPGVKVLKAIFVNRKMVIYENHWGVTIRNLLQDQRIPLMVQQRAQKKYFTLIKYFGQDVFSWASDRGYRLTDVPSDDVMRIPYRMFLSKPEGDSFSLMIKDDNVLYEYPTGNLIVFDSH